MKKAILCLIGLVALICGCNQALPLPKSNTSLSGSKHSVVQSGSATENASNVLGRGASDDNADAKKTPSSPTASIAADDGSATSSKKANENKNTTTSIVSNRSTQGSAPTDIAGTSDIGSTPSNLMTSKLDDSMDSSKGTNEKNNAITLPDDLW